MVDDPIPVGRHVANKATRQSDKNPTRSGARTRTAPFDDAGLIQLVADLHALNREKQAFVYTRFLLGEDLLDEYKKL